MDAHFFVYCHQALQSHDDAKPSPSPRSDLCKDPSMQRTHMPGVRHVTMQQSNARKGAVAQAVPQITEKEAAVVGRVLQYVYV